MNTHILWASSFKPQAFFTLTPRNDELRFALSLEGKSATKRFLTTDGRLSFRGVHPSGGMGYVYPTVAYPTLFSVPPLGARHLLIYISQRGPLLLLLPLLAKATHGGIGAKTLYKPNNPHPNQIS